jgi:hypothetical protein
MITSVVVAESKEQIQNEKLEIIIKILAVVPSAAWDF